MLNITPVQYLSLRHLLPDLAESYSVEFGLLFLEEPNHARHFERLSPEEIPVHALAHLSSLLPLEAQYGHLYVLAEVALQRWEEEPPFTQQKVASFHTLLEDAIAGRCEPQRFFQKLYQITSMDWERLNPHHLTRVEQACHCLEDLGASMVNHLHDLADASLGPVVLHVSDSWICLNGTPAELAVLRADLLARVRSLFEANP